MAPGTPGLLGGEVDMVARCMTCHDEPTFNLRHEHNLNVLKDCNLCHDVHASTREKMLKAPRAEVCGYCHDSHGAH